MKMKVVRLMMAITADQGVIVKWFVNSPFDSNHMANFLKAIYNVVPLPAHIFVDNASYHTSRATRAELKRLRFRVIYNKPYNPAYNPIEYTFASIKNEFRKMRLKSLRAGDNTPPEVLVRRAVNTCTQKSVRNTIIHVLKKWQDTDEWKAISGAL